METITNPTELAAKKAQEAIDEGQKWSEKTGLCKDRDTIHFSFGWLKSELATAYATIANLQKELDKPRCEECGSDCTETRTRDSVFGEATTLHCESCEHESEPF